MVSKIIKQSVPSQYLFSGGYASFSSDTLDGYHYYIQDYMGNNRMVVNGQTGATEQVTHYYPYGGVIGDISYTDTLITNDYKFEGKELDRTFGLDWYDIHARQYDAIGVPGWTSIDPLAEKNPGISPYTYCLGNPVNNIDMNGLDTLNITGYYNENGGWKWNIDYRSGGAEDIYNVTNPNGNKTTYTFSSEADISQLTLEEANNCRLSVINIKGENIYGFAVNPLGDPSNTENSGRVPKSGIYDIVSNNYAGKWKCAGPKVMDGTKDREIRIHYAGTNYTTSERINPSLWTSGCSVVSSDYIKDSSGNVIFRQNESYSLYCRIQTNLGGTKKTYKNSNNADRVGFIFNLPINKKMQFIH